MEHQHILWILQACFDAFVALGPIFAIALLSWRVAR